MDDVQNAGIKDRQEAHNHSVLSARGALFRIYLCTKIFWRITKPVINPSLCYTENQMGRKDVELDRR